MVLFRLLFGLPPPFLEDRKRFIKLMEVLILASYDSTFASLLLFAGEFSRRLGVSDEGILVEAKDTLVESLMGVDIKRLRKCDPCMNIFWARRMDALSCSAKCNNYRRTKLNRRLRAEKFESAFKSRVKETNKQIASLGESE